ncbi:hypothetical protein TRVL_09789 [Trypanosoma vivax]|nr:hypothetical protein TRVL_09789 [Trypanosoma vivax]
MRIRLLCVDGRLALQRHLACFPSFPSGAPRKIPHGAPSPRSASKQPGLRGCDRPREPPNATSRPPVCNATAALTSSCWKCFLSETNRFECTAENRYPLSP